MATMGDSRAVRLLRSMDVDLSEQLRPRKQPTPAQASSSHAAAGDLPVAYTAFAAPVNKP